MTREQKLAHERMLATLPVRTHNAVEAGQMNWYTGKPLDERHEKRIRTRLLDGTWGRLRKQG
jgi:hypothetical protein